MDSRTLLSGLTHQMTMRQIVALCLQGMVSKFSTRQDEQVGQPVREGSSKEDSNRLLRPDLLTIVLDRHIAGDLRSRRPDLDIDTITA